MGDGDDEDGNHSLSELWVRSAVLRGGGGDKKILCRYPSLQLLSLPVRGGGRNVLGVQLLLSAEKPRGVKVVKHYVRTKLGVNCF